MTRTLSVVKEICETIWQVNYVKKTHKKLVMSLMQVCRKRDNYLLSSTHTFLIMSIIFHTVCVIYHVLTINTKQMFFYVKNEHISN
jgi:hypothetical protein